MILDGKLQTRLLKPMEGKSKAQLAFKEAGNIKKVISYLRFLWRATPKSKNKTVMELKSLLQKKATNEETAPALCDGEPADEAVDPLYSAVLDAMGLDPEDADAIGNLNVEHCALQQESTPAPKPPDCLEE
eukprot:8579351-Pyramimonas_sp.AAC.1